MTELPAIQTKDLEVVKMARRAASAKFDHYRKVMTADLPELKTPEPDRYVECGEVRPLPMFHLSTLLQYGERVAEEAVRMERETYKELWTAAARVALSNGFDAAYPENLEALQSLVQSTRYRLRRSEVAP